MGALLVAVHLNGRTNVLLDAESPAEARQLDALLKALEPDIGALQARVQGLIAHTAEAAPGEPDDSAPRKAKRGRPRGSASGFDKATKVRIIREARQLRTQGITWEGIHARTGISADTLRRWMHELRET